MLTKVIEIRRIEIRCDAGNVRSVAVASRCGFELDGRTRCDLLDPHGRLRDTLVFSRISSQ